jgi:hypothetical protein
VRPASDEKERFLAKVLANEIGCHEWQASLDRGGYGKFAFRGNTAAKAHRVSYQLFVGPIPEGVNVLHQCDNRKCVNPGHLFLGTAADNVADMDAKGRRGTKSRLTKNDVATIKELIAARHTQAAIAKIFRVDQTTISRINLGKKD